MTITYQFIYTAIHNGRPVQTCACSGDGLPTHIHPQAGDILVIWFRGGE